MAFTLPRQLRALRITEKDGTPTAQMQQFWQTVVEKIEAQEERQDAILSALKLTTSFTNPVGVLTARQDGAIQVANHTRVYGDGTTVTVNGGSPLTRFANGARVNVYYIDADQEGGSVEYLGTTKAVSQIVSTHIVGQVVIPALAAPDNTGSGPTAPGYTAPPEGVDASAIEYEPDALQPGFSRP